MLLTSWCPLPSSCSHLTPHVLVAIDDSGCISFYEESAFSQDLYFILRETSFFGIAASDVSQVGFCWETSSTSSLHTTFTCGHHHNHISLHEDDLVGNTQSLTVIINSTLKHYSVSHSSPISYSSPTLVIQADEGVMCNLSSHIIIPAIHDHEGIQFLSCDGEITDVTPYSVSPYLLNVNIPLKAAALSDQTILLQDEQNHFYFWNSDHSITQSAFHLPSADSVVYAIRNDFIVFRNLSGISIEKESKCVLTVKMENIKCIHNHGDQIIVSDGKQVKILSLPSLDLITVECEDLVDVFLLATNYVILVTSRGIQYGEVKEGQVHWIDMLSLSSIRFACSCGSCVFLLNHESLFILRVHATISLITSFPLSGDNPLMMVSSPAGEYAYLIMEKQTFVFSKQRENYCLCSQYATPSSPLFATVTSSYELLLVTPFSIYQGGSSLVFVDKGYSHPLLDEGNPVNQLSLQEFSFFENTSLPILHSLSILTLFLIQQYSFFEQLVSTLAMKVRQEVISLDLEQYMDSETIQRKGLRLSCLVLQPSSKGASIPFQVKCIDECIEALDHIHFIEFSDQEEDQFKKLLLIYKALYSTRTTKDLDLNAFHFLLIVFLYHSQIIPLQALPSSAFLHAALSNCKDTLLTEALLLMIESRLSIQNEALIFNASSVKDTSSSDIVVSIQPDVEDKYRELFTFTSNRYNISVKPQVPSVTRIEDYRSYVVWKDVRSIALPLWYVNQSVYTELALKIGMVKKQDVF